MLKFSKGFIKMNQKHVKLVRGDDYWEHVQGNGGGKSERMHV